MKKLINIGFIASTLVVITSCGISEQFVQDDVYTKKSPALPLGTDLTDNLNYSTYVAQKMMQENDVVYITPANSSTFSPYEAMMMNRFNRRIAMGNFSFFNTFSPSCPECHSNFTGLWGYTGYSNFYGYPFYNYYVPYASNFYVNDFNSFYAMHAGGYAFSPYLTFYNSTPYYGGGGYSYYNTPKHKPTGMGSISNASAGTSKGRFGSSGGQVTYYANQLKPSTTVRTASTKSPNFSNSIAGRAETTTTDGSNRPTAVPTTGRHVATVRTNVNPTVVSVPNRATNEVANMRTVRPVTTTRPTVSTVTRSSVVTNGRVSTPNTTHPTGTIMRSTPSVRTTTPTPENRTISTPSVRTSSPSVGGGTVGRSSGGSYNSGGRR